MTGIILDIEGTELTAQDKELLQHPGVAGVILFTRNYHDPVQLCELTKSIRAAAAKPLLITVDHEGGRVQRFREGFVHIPAMAEIARQAETENQAIEFAQSLGWLMASEVLACNIDHSFAPVLDIQGKSEVIGDRAFGTAPEQVARLAGAFMQGMRTAGMKTTGKHFPGHGTVVADSHIAIPVDERDLDAIEKHDLKPFEQLCSQLDAVMPAHVVYPQVDELPAGFSPFWLQQVLRKQLGFKGVIISDDLTMEGAAVVGGFAERAERALDAGGELVLVCNNRDAAIEVIDKVKFPKSDRCPVAHMQGVNPACTFDALKESSEWQRAARLAQWLNANRHS